LLFGIEFEMQVSGKHLAYFSDLELNSGKGIGLNKKNNFLPELFFVEGTKSFEEKRLKLKN